VISELGLSPDRIDVVYLGVDTTRFQPSLVPDSFRTRYHLPAGLRYVLYLGTEDPRKNLPALLRAVALAGRGAAPAFADQRAAHLRLCWELGIASAVRWIDEVPEADLPIFYNVADLFAFPSRFEGFGFPVLEALACGTPVVAARTGLIPELTGDAATLLEDLEPANLAAAITRTITRERPDPDTLINQARRFPWRATLEATLAIIASVSLRTIVGIRTPAAS
jgi:glycosyltransferase involved in cell wall biosynthesis